VYRNKKLLEVARLLPCQHCGIEDGTVVAAHSNQLRDGKGRGLKSSDFRIASLCFRCHAEADTSSTLTKVARIEMWEQAHRATIGELFERGLVGVIK
jgi:cytochrome c553